MAGSLEFPFHLPCVAEPVSFGRERVRAEEEPFKR